MEPEPTVLDSLRRAVEAMPDDVPLRLHLATLLMRGGQRDEAIRHLEEYLHISKPDDKERGWAEARLAELRH